MLPLTFDRGPWSRRASLRASVSSRDVSDISVDETPVTSVTDGEMYLKEGTRTELTWSLGVRQSLAKAPMALAPRWGQSVYFTRSSTPFGGDLQGTYQAGEATFTLPGLRPLHSLAIAGSWQQTEGDYQPLSSVFTPHGYTLPASGSLRASGVAYSLPLAYPDRSIGPFVFVQRLRGGVFYEQATENGSTRIQAVGGQLLLDLKPMRLPVRIESGVDAGVRLDTGESFVLAATSAIIPF